MIVADVIGWMSANEGVGLIEMSFQGGFTVRMHDWGVFSPWLGSFLRLWLNVV